MTLSCSRRTAPDMTTHYCAGAAAAATCLALAMLAACANGGQAQQVAVLPLAGVSLRPTNSSTALALFTPRRRRRYVRFPAHTASDAVVAPGSGRLTYPHNPRPPPVSHTGYNSWVPVRHKQPHYQVSAPTAGGHYTRVPQMGQRSPRLVFRDPDVPGTIRASSPFYTQQTPNGLQDITADDSRGCGVSIGKLGPSLGAQRRIVGGDEAGFGSFPWQAYIRIGSSRCGGSLVNRYHVVTAGHCVARASARQVQVTLGDYVINSAVEPLPAYTFGVREIRVHPYFKFTPQADRFDVAVLRLDRPVQYMPHIAPICLPEKNEDFLGQYGWAAGWGALQAGSRLRPKTLQAVDVPVIDNRLCERWHKSNGINVVIYEEMMCAGYRGGGKDSCQGDSGGPLMMEKAGRWYLIGIVSAGYSCAQRGQPGIYHRVAHTVDWISYIVNST
ncbi:chymotrypsin-like protease CTRL-1 isoform X2 [Periplaneta americana]|uniref:chymotrypsin-like protease CTRL-1 isoform X2 n=1 Tax=Periplaneta americana TaxID=6978 RepID=UPI0037E88E3C